MHLPVRYGDINLKPPSLLTAAPDGNLTFAAGSVINAANPKLVIPATLWNSNSFYDSLQINVIQQVTHGLSFQAVFAWAKSIDEGSSEVNGNDNFNTIDNPYPFIPRLQRAVSDWNVPQHLTLNFDWLVPSPHFGMVLPRFLLSGWELGGIYTVQSGIPFSVQITGDQAGTGSHVSKNGQRPNLVPGCSPNAVSPGNPVNYIIESCFTFPKGELGNSARNSLRGPGLQDFDFSLFKNHNVGEKLKIQFRAEFFNLFNLTAFAPHTQTIFTKAGALLPGNAALIGPTAIDQREIQFGMKFIF